MPLNLNKPPEGEVGWTADVNQNFTDIETHVNAFGTLAGQNADAVAITGGSVAGISDLAVADGGTGASSVAGAQASLQVPPRTRSIGTASPLTGGGDLTSDRTISFATQAANTVLAAPNGSSGAPDFRALVADDVPALDASKITSGALDETVGGTGQTNFATGDLLYASASNTLSKLAAGTDGHVLTLANGVPSWAAAAGGGGAGAWSLVEDKVVASDITTVTFSSLDGDSDGAYMLVGWLRGPSTTTSFELRPNGTNVLSWWINPASPSAMEISFISYIRASRSASGVALVRPCLTIVGVGSSSGAVRSHSWSDTTTNITSLEVVASQTSQIRAGSRLTLFKVNA